MALAARLLNDRSSQADAGQGVHSSCRPLRTPKKRFCQILRDIDVRQLRTAAECWDQLADGGTLMENQTRRTRKTEQSELPVEPLPGPASDSPPTVLALIERVALDPRADAEKPES